MAIHCPYGSGKFLEFLAGKNLFHKPIWKIFLCYLSTTYHWNITHSGWRNDTPNCRLKKSRPFLIGLTNDYWSRVCSYIHVSLPMSLVSSNVTCFKAVNCGTSFLSTKTDHFLWPSHSNQIFEENITVWHFDILTYYLTLFLIISHLSRITSSLWYNFHTFCHITYFTLSALILLGKKYNS